MVITKQQAESYILEHKNNYPKESIKIQLLNSGMRSEEVDILFKQIYRVSTSNSDNVKKRSSLGLILLIIFLIILPIALIIGGIVAYNYTNFDSMLPNKVELSNNLRADTVSSMYDSSINEFELVFRYNGAKRANINLNKSELITIDGNSCEPIYLKNLDVDSTQSSLVIFLNGQDGIIKFYCPNYDNKKDFFEGTVNISLVYSTTSLEVPSTGNIRFAIE